MSFDKLLQDSEKAYEAMRAKYKEQTSKQFKNDDERLWYPEADKAGNGSAVIRFLPHKDGPTGIPWVRTFQHAFKGPTGSWLIENCPTTLGQPCPICERNTQLWNSGKQSDKDLGSKQKRKVYYYSNILVINDPGNKENNGHVKIFRYGQKIYKMLMGKLFPEFGDVKKVDPFHFIKGADFRLRFKKGEGGFRNYDHSTFDEPSPLLEGDKDRLRKVYESMYDLDEFIDPSLYKDYEQLKKRLQLVNGEFSERPPTEVQENLVLDRLDEPKQIESAAKVDTAPADPAFDLDDTETTDFDAFFDDLKD